MKKLVSICIFIFCTSLFAQGNINSFKYVLVPKQYEFQKKEDQYQINSLTKFLFNKHGFTAIFSEDSYPTDLANNGCLALRAVIKKQPGLFNTKLNISLYNCKNKIVFTTNEGYSKLKDFKRAYHEAIRMSFKDIENLDYAYNVKLDDKRKEVKLVKEEKAVVVPVLKKDIVEKPVAKSIKKINKKKAVSSYSIEGKYLIENWGESIISKKGNDFKIVGGDENFEFATIYKTSMSNLYIIKWVAFKQPQLLELDKKGNLKVDSINAEKLFKRLD